MKRKPPGQIDIFTGDAVADPEPSKFAPRLDQALDAMPAPATWSAETRQNIYRRIVHGELLDDLQLCLAAYATKRRDDRLGYWRQLEASSTSCKQSDNEFARNLLDDLKWVAEKGQLLRTCLDNASIPLDSFVDNILKGFAKEWNFFVRMQDRELFADVSDAPP